MAALAGAAAAPSVVVAAPPVKLESWLKSSYGTSNEYLEKIVNSSPISQQSKVRSSISGQDDVNKRNREKAIAEWSVHMTASILCKLKRETAFSCESAEVFWASRSAMNSYKCLRGADNEQKLRMHSAVYVFLTTLLSKRHTKKFNIRLIEAQIVETCMEYLNSEMRHASIHKL